MPAVGSCIHVYTYNKGWLLDLCSWISGFVGPIQEQCFGGYHQPGVFQDMCR